MYLEWLHKRPQLRTALSEQSFENSSLLCKSINPLRTAVIKGTIRLCHVTTKTEGDAGISGFRAEPLDAFCTVIFHREGLFLLMLGWLSLVAMLERSAVE